MRRHHKRGTARFGCLRRFCLSTHSESFGVIRWPECDCVCAGVGLSGGRGRLLTHVHRASACTLNAVGLLPVSGRGDARVAPPCPTTLCVWRNLPYLTLPYAPSLPTHPPRLGPRRGMSDSFSRDWREFCKNLCDTPHQILFLADIAELCRTARRRNAGRLPQISPPRPTRTRPSS